MPPPVWLMKIPPAASGSTSTSKLATVQWLFGTIQPFPPRIRGLTPLPKLSSRPGPAALVRTTVDPCSQVSPARNKQRAFAPPLSTLQSVPRAALNPLAVADEITMCLLESLVGHASNPEPPGVPLLAKHQ